MKLYPKSERSSFGYWFAHWCAFQIIALLSGLWKPKYLLHDIEKPWLRLFWKYEKVQKWHRFHNNHHLEYLVSHDISKFDFTGIVIDWECGRLTKESSPLNAKQYFGLEREKLLGLLGGDKTRPEYRAFNKNISEILKNHFS